MNVLTLFAGNGMEIEGSLSLGNPSIFHAGGQYGGFPQGRCRVIQGVQARVRVHHLV